MNIPTKQCNGCKEEKPCYEFFRCKTTWDRLNTKCKDCIQKAKRPTELEKLRKNNPERSDVWWRNNK